MPILTLAEAKSQLNISTSADDAELQTYIDAAETVVDTLCGPVITRTVTETVRGGGPTVILRTPPVVSLTSMVSIRPTGPTVDVSTLHLDGPSGVVRMKSGGWFTEDVYTVVYSAGRGTTAPANINLAARIIVAHLWRTQRGGMAPSVLADDDTVTQVAGVGFAVPNRALQLLGPRPANIVVA